MRQGLIWIVAALSVEVLAGSVNAQTSSVEASEGTITITYAGAAVTSWANNHDAYDVNSQFRGGIVLGGGIGESEPIYVFVLPPPVLTPGLTEMTQLTVTVKGKGSSLGSASVSIGGLAPNRLHKDGEDNPFVFSGPQVNELLKPIEGVTGLARKLEIRVSSVGWLDWYDLNEIDVQYSYSNIQTSTLLHFHEAYEGYIELKRFNDLILQPLWKSQNIVPYDKLKESFFTTLGFLIGWNWSNLSPWLLPVDLFLKLKDFEKTTSSIEYYMMAPLAVADFYGSMDDFPSKASTAINSGCVQLRFLAETWLSASSDGKISSEDQSKINSAVTDVNKTISNIIGNLKGLCSQTKNARDYEYRLPTPDAILGVTKQVGDIANAMFPTLTPMLQDANPPGQPFKADPKSFLLLFAKAIDEQSFSTPTEPSPPSPPPRAGNYLTISSPQWDDYGGDKDGIMEAGEQVRLRVYLHSTVNVHNVESVATTDNSDVTVHTADNYWDDFGPGNSKISHGGGVDLIFNFTGHHVVNVTLNLTYEYGGLPYEQQLHVSTTVYTQSEHQVAFKIDGTPQIAEDMTDNRDNVENGIFESGESVFVSPALVNQGNAAATDITMTVLYNGPSVIDVLYPGPEPYPDLPVGQESKSSSKGFRLVSTKPSFSGAVSFDVAVACKELATPDTIRDAFQLLIQPTPILDVQNTQNTNSGINFGHVRPGEDVFVSVRVRNRGSAPLAVEDVSADHDDVTISQTDQTFTLQADSYRDIPVTITTDAIHSGTTITRTVTVTSEARTANTNKPTNQLAIKGLVSDVPTGYQAPGISQRAMPDISDSIVVWRDSRDGSSIYAYNLQNQREFIVTDPHYNADNPRVSGPLIAWEDLRNNQQSSPPFNRDIYAFDIQAGQEFPVSTNESDEALVEVDNGVVAFTRNDFSWVDAYGNKHGGWNLYIYDVNTKQTTKVTDFAVPGSGSDLLTVYSSNFDFSDGVVALKVERHQWLSAQGGPSSGSKNEIWRYRVDTDAKAASIGVASVGTLGTGGGRIAWVDNGQNNKDQVFVWENGNVRQITNHASPGSGVDQNNLGMGGDFVVYRDNSGEGGFYYDLSEGREYVLSTTGSLNSPRTDGKGIVWISENTVKMAFPKEASWRINTPPVFAADTKLPAAVVGMEYRAIVNVFDPDSTDTVTLQVVNGPAWMTATRVSNEIHSLSGTPTMSDTIVASTIVLRAYDGIDSSEVSLTYAVVSPPKQVSLGTASGNTGGKATVPISVDDASGIASGEFTLSYDPNALTAKSVTPADLLTSAGITVNPNLAIPGQVNIPMSGASGITSGSGTLMTITFEIASNAPEGPTPLNLQASLKDGKGNSIPSIAADGSVTVTIGMQGDVDTSGVVDSGDAIRVLRYSVGFPPPLTSEQQVLADVNCDGEINSADAILILRFAVGLIDSFPCMNNLAKPALVQNSKELPVLRIEPKWSSDGGLVLDAYAVSFNNLAGGDLIIHSGTIKIRTEDVNIDGLAPDALVVTNTSIPGELHVSFAGTLQKSKDDDSTPLRLTLSGLPHNESIQLGLTGQFYDSQGMLITRTTQDYVVAALPTAFALLPNRPNPFNPTTTIAYELPEAGNVLLDVYSITGQRIRRLVNSRMEAGRYTVTWDSRDDAGRKVGSGIYLYRLAVDDTRFVACQRMLLLK